MNKTTSLAQFAPLCQLALLGLSLAALTSVACSSGGSSQGVIPPVPQAPGSPTGPGTDGKPGPGGTGTAPKAPGMDWLSDIRDAVVAPCTDAQVFARETCWDEVNFSETRLSLRRPGEELVVFESGLPLSEGMAKLYRYSGDAYMLNSIWEGDDQSLISEGIERLREKILGSTNGFIRYWFLPHEVAVSRTPGRALKDELAISAEFPLAFSFGHSLTRESGTARDWTAKGTATICGKALALPLLQKNLEAACGWNIGTGQVLTEVHASGNELIFHISGSDSDLGSRSVKSVEFRATDRKQP